ncbi:hypothetical protein RIF29_22049 [Crotalaria pallida]|uniref:Hexosyltransferase n=1 Tax=Crotalaria pallida TaxID=3830 RepID=A0AAN9F8L5_CROPI
MRIPSLPFPSLLVSSDPIASSSVFTSTNKVGASVPEDSRMTESSGKRKYLIIIGINTAFSNRREEIQFVPPGCHKLRIMVSDKVLTHTHYSSFSFLFFLSHPSPPPTLLSHRPPHKTQLGLGLGFFPLFSHSSLSFTLLSLTHTFHSITQSLTSLLSFFILFIYLFILDYSF